MSGHLIMPELTVTSEIYEEYDYRTNKTPSKEGNVISEFPFIVPQSDAAAAARTAHFDADGDLDIERPQREVIQIEHRARTELGLVGLQVWRGALLLGDWVLELARRGRLAAAAVLELGAGTGLAGLAAARHARSVVCTDIEAGGILELIRVNAKYNAESIRSRFRVMALDFTAAAWGADLQREVRAADIVMAADVIYDDELTAAFVSTARRILDSRPPKTLYVVLEKRYVFTAQHLDSVAPCYDTFLTLLDKVKTENMNSTWEVEQLPLDFPQYFTYERVPELVLWSIRSRPRAAAAGVTPPL